MIKVTIRIGLNASRPQQYRRYTPIAMANITTIPYERNLRPLFDGTAGTFTK